MNILVAFLVFSLIVLFHELGHFIFAKLNHVKVEEFSLGMGPRILSWQGKETRYSWKLLPLGGSCMMLGEDTVSDSDRAFSNASLPARMSIVFAGPLFNLILAFLLSLVVLNQAGVDLPVLHHLGTESTPVLESGLQEGDTITSFEGAKITTYRDLVTKITFHQSADEVTIEYLRDGVPSETVLTPKQREDGTAYYGLPAYGERTKVQGLSLVGYSFHEVVYWVQTTVYSLKELVTGKVGMEDISGPVGIVSYIGETYEETVKESITTMLLNMANISILLSANLGVMNLLPIPALDGGRLFFMLIECITRKRIPEDKEGFIHFLGFVCLMILMVIIFMNDIRNLIG
ncbi:MAG: M50 family metallopeptidase [Lachnospiraceae bacterium]